MLIFIVIVLFIVIVTGEGAVEVKGGEERDVEDDGEEEEEEGQVVQTTRTTLTTLDQKSHQISTVECLNGETSVL